MPRPCAHSIRRGEFVLVHALERDGVDLDLEAGGLRGVDAFEHLVESPQRVTARNFSGSSVSSETLMRRTPHAASSAAYFSSCDPLVVSVSSSSAPARGGATASANERHDAAPHQRLAAGQPKLAHAARDEGRAQPVELFERQQVALWAGTTCAPPCNRRSGNRSGRSPTRADRRWSRPNGSTSAARLSLRSSACGSPDFISTLSIGTRFHDISRHDLLGRPAAVSRAMLGGSI